MVTFSPNLTNFIGNVVGGCQVTSVCDKGLRTLKRWPYKQTAANCDMNYAIYTAKIEFEAGELAMSLAMQQKGYSVETVYPESKDISPYESCECITGLFVCINHRLAEHHMIIEGRKSIFRFTSIYDDKHGFKGQKYYLYS